MVLLAGSPELSPQYPSIINWLNCDLFARSEGSGKSAHLHIFVSLCSFYFLTFRLL